MQGMAPLQEYLVATRPWSATATVVPVMATSALMHRLGNVQGGVLDVILLTVGALAIHSGANLTNTYFDFKHGVDDDGSDDLTLVKNRLPVLCLHLCTNGSDRTGRFDLHVRRLGCNN